MDLSEGRDESIKLLVTAHLNQAIRKSKEKFKL
jgi:hypothetical protein